MFIVLFSAFFGESFFQREENLLEMVSTILIAGDCGAHAAAK